MKKTISRQVFFDAKALLDQGKTQAKVAKKLKIGTGTVSKIKNSKTYTAYCGKKYIKGGHYGFAEALKKVSQPTRELPERINYSEVNRDKTAIDSIFRNKLVDMTGLDHNFALDKKVKKLQVEVKKNPAFAKFVEGQVALVVDEKVAKARAEREAVLQEKLDKITELTMRKDELTIGLQEVTKMTEYKQKVLDQYESITKNLSKIVVPVGILIGFIWISWLLVTHFR